MKIFYQKIKYFLKKYERLVLPVSLIFGFIIDSLTLNRADGIFDNLIILSYLLIVAISIFFIHVPNFKTKISPFLPIIIQFSFGNLFSALVVFYTRSGSLVVSFPFLIILLALFIGSDWFHKKYTKLTFQISIFYIALFSYFTLITPVLFRKINAWVFVLGGIFSLITILIFVSILEKGLKENFIKYKKGIYISLTTIYLLFNLFYLINVIPPIPLSLREAIVSHNITRLESGNYEITYEKPKWFRFYRDYAPTIHINKNESVYVFGSIYAPTKLKGATYHQWSYFDEKESRWKDTDRIKINISGGRDKGFRGYSKKSSLIEGKWRVDIETNSKQVIGRIPFNISIDGKTNKLVTEEF